MKSLFLKIKAWLQRHGFLTAAVIALVGLVTVAAIWTGVTALIPVLVTLPLFFFWLAYIGITAIACTISYYIVFSAITMDMA